MAAALALRDDFDGADLRRLARQSRDADQVRRLLSLAAIYDGASRTEAARLGGVGVQIVRDWAEPAKKVPLGASQVEGRRRGFGSMAKDRTGCSTARRRVGVPCWKTSSGTRWH